MKKKKKDVHGPRESIQKVFRTSECGAQISAEFKKKTNLSR